MIRKMASATFWAEFEGGLCDFVYAIEWYTQKENPWEDSQFWPSILNEIRKRYHIARIITLVAARVEIVPREKYAQAY